MLWGRGVFDVCPCVSVTVGEIGGKLMILFCGILRPGYLKTSLMVKIDGVLCMSVMRTRRYAIEVRMRKMSDSTLYCLGPNIGSRDSIKVGTSDECVGRWDIIRVHQVLLYGRE